MKKLLINEVVVNSAGFGGIQSYANSVISEVKNSSSLILNNINWISENSFFSKAILRFLPNFLGSLYFNLFLKKNYDSQVKFDGLFHFWNVEPAIGFEKPFILTCHGTEVLEDSFSNFRKYAYTSVFQNATLIHAVSNFTKEKLISLHGCDSEKIIVIPPSINFQKYGSFNLKKKPSKKIVFGTLTRFVKRKNVINIIKALNLLCSREDFYFEYHLAGDGPQKNAILEELSNAKFEWVYHGRVSDDFKLNSFFPSLDYFLFCPLALKNDVEGFGIVYLEANAMGIPVLASKTGGIPDAVTKKTGVFADPLNIKDIADQIINLTQKNFDEVYLKNWASRFDASIVAKEIMSLYFSKKLELK